MNSKYIIDEFMWAAETAIDMHRELCAIPPMKRSGDKYDQKVKGLYAQVGAANALWSIVADFSGEDSPEWVLGINTDEYSEYAALRDGVIQLHTMATMGIL